VQGRNVAIGRSRDDFPNDFINLGGLNHLYECITDCKPRRCEFMWEVL
jgi:hypothetical protein